MLKGPKRSFVVVLLFLVAWIHEQKFFQMEQKNVCEQKIFVVEQKKLLNECTVANTVVPPNSRLIGSKKKPGIGKSGN